MSATKEKEKKPYLENRIYDQGGINLVDANGMYSGNVIGASAPSATPINSNVGSVGATDGTTSDGASVTATAPVKTFEQYIAEGDSPSEAYNKFYRDNAYATAEKQRIEAERRAEVERQRAIVDARTSYEQNVASYGANAEALAGMGLTGSGYGDYLASRAYAQMRDDTQAANAIRTKTVNEALYTEGQNKLAADSEYYKNLAAIDATKKAEEASKNEAYLQLLNGANSGAYTAEQLPELAKNAGLDETLTANLVNAANDYKAKVQATYNAEIAANLGDDIGAIKAAIESGAISAEDGNARVVDVQDQNFEAFAKDIKAGIADGDDIHSAYESGKISHTQYKNLEAMWNNDIDLSLSFFQVTDATGSIKMIPKSEAKAAIDNVCNNKLCSQSTKDYLRALYAEEYTPTKRDVTFKDDDKFLFFGSNDLAVAGNNFTVKKGETTYHIQSAGEVTDQNIKEVASSIGNDEVFGYQDAIYIKKDGRVFKIEKRTNSYAKSYSDLYNVFFGSGQ